MLAASKVKMSGSEKNKSERNTYNISSIKRVIRGSTRACECECVCSACNKGNRRRLHAGNHIERDYLLETLSQHPRLYRTIELHENDKFNMTDSEQLLRENNPVKNPSR